VKENTKLAKYANKPDIDLFEIFQEYMFDAINVDDDDWDDILTAGAEAGMESQKTGAQLTYVTMDDTVFIFCLSREKEAAIIKDLKQAGKDAKTDESQPYNMAKRAARGE
jgi:hypothetical protein